MKILSPYAAICTYTQRSLQFGQQMTLELESEKRIRQHNMLHDSLKPHDFLHTDYRFLTIFKPNKLKVKMT